MADLPRGTVIFLFTDIEGSTRLAARLRARYAEVLAEHHRVLRVAIGEHGGRVVGTEGDAFFVAFGRARDADRRSGGGATWLTSARWPETAHVRVRRGLHTGEATVRDEGYIGLDVHRAARICSAAAPQRRAARDPHRARRGRQDPSGVGGRAGDPGRRPRRRA